LHGKQFFRKHHKLICFARREQCVDVNTRLRPSSAFEPLSEPRKACLHFRIILGGAHEHPNPPHALRLLRTRTKRPRSRCAPEERDEVAAGHSMTSSAVASSDGGTVRPSTRAVWWLMTKSILFDCTTGNSADFAPLRMRPT
jgi:hypothetical protein